MKLRTPAGIAALLGLYAFSLSLASCSPNQPPAPNDPSVTTAQTNTTGTIEGRTKLLMPEVLYGHDTALVALTIQSEKKGKETRDTFQRHAAASFIELEISMDAAATTHTSWVTRSTRWHNVLFRDLASNESWMLLDTRGVVSAFSKALPIGTSPETHRQVRTGPIKLLAFLVTTDDTDNDGVLTSMDARVCIITDGDGRNPRTITPKDQHVLSTRYDHDRDLLWIQVTSDTDGDGKFTGLDDQSPMVFDPKTDTTARAVIEYRVIERARDLFGE